MVLDLRVVLERLHTLDEYVRLLQPYRDWSARQLTQDRTTYGGVLHYLQLSAQIVLDVSAHLNAELGLGRAADYREAVLSLGRHGVLPAEFARRRRAGRLSQRPRPPVPCRRSDSNRADPPGRT